MEYLLALIRQSAVPHYEIVRIAPHSKRCGQVAVCLVTRHGGVEVRKERHGKLVSIPFQTYR